MLRPQLTKREKVIAVVLAGLLTLLVGWRIIIQPSFYESENLDNQITLTQERIARSLSSIKEAKALESKYGDYLQKLRQTQPDHQVMTSIIDAVESVAGRIGLRIVDLKPRKVRQENSMNEFSINMVLEGDLTQVLNFINTLQQQEHNFEVDELGLSRKSPRESALKCQLVLTKYLSVLK